MYLNVRFAEIRWNGLSSNESRSLRKADIQGTEDSVRAAEHRGHRAMRYVEPADTETRRRELTRMMLIMSGTKDIMEKHHIKSMTVTRLTTEMTHAGMTAVMEENTVGMTMMGIVSIVRRSRGHRAAVCV